MDKVLILGVWNARISLPFPDVKICTCPSKRLFQLRNRP
jgi:hypothetical protein